MRYAAFLRALNVGGHTVKMDALKKIFESLGFKNVETFIASGNVVFETASKNAASLEKKIAAALEARLGYEVASFLRTSAELAELAAYTPFKGLDDAPTFVVGFLHTPLDAAAVKRLMAVSSRADRFHVRGREIWWHSTNSQADSTFSNKAFEKLVGARTTFRNVRTVRKMAAKWGS